MTAPAHVAPVDVLAVMKVACTTRAHAVIAQTADGDIEAAKRAFGRIAKALDGVDEARAAVAELIEAAQLLADFPTTSRRDRVHVILANIRSAS